LKNIYYSLDWSQLEYSVIFWSTNTIISIKTLETVQNSFLQYHSFKCRVDRPPHSSYNGILEFFNITSLKSCRNYLILNFLFKLLKNEIDCDPLLENLNYKINIAKTRNNHLFFLKNIKTNYLLYSPTNILMSIGNSTHIDLFYCNTNDIKNMYKLA